MKPSWKDAPEWAQWLAMDEDGQWVWFETEPHLVSDQEWFRASGRCAYVSVNDFRQSLEPRP